MCTNGAVLEPPFSVFSEPFLIKTEFHLDSYNFFQPPNICGVKRIVEFHNTKSDVSASSPSLDRRREAVATTCKAEDDLVTPVPPLLLADEKNAVGIDGASIILRVLDVGWADGFQRDVGDVVIVTAWNIKMFGEPTDVP